MYNIYVTAVQYKSDDHKPVGKTAQIKYGFALYKLGGPRQVI